MRLIYVFKTYAELKYFLLVHDSVNNIDVSVSFLDILFMLLVAE